MRSADTDRGHTLRCGAIGHFGVVARTGGYRRYAGDEYSEIARRMTNLFADPLPREVVVNAQQRFSLSCCPIVAPATRTSLSRITREA